MFSQNNFDTVLGHLTAAIEEGITFSVCLSLSFKFISLDLSSQRSSSILTSRFLATRVILISVEAVPGSIGRSTVCSGHS